MRFNLQTIGRRIRKLSDNVRLIIRHVRNAKDNTLENAKAIRKMKFRAYRQINNLDHITNVKGSMSYDNAKISGVIFTLLSILTFLYTFLTILKYISMQIDKSKYNPTYLRNALPTFVEEVRSAVHNKQRAVLGLAPLSSRKTIV